MERIGRPANPGLPPRPLWYPPILAYHRVHPDGATDTPTISPEIFGQQMAILAERWKPVPLLDLVIRLEEGQPFDRREVAVTFDDGTEDNFTHAYPVLKQHRVPATIFLITENIGQPGFLSKTQIAEMADQGTTFGSHTLHHAYLPKLPMDCVREELVESRRKLQGMGLAADLMSYPAGGFSQEIAHAVQEAGYRAACTTNRGLQRFPVDRWALRRNTMHANATTPFGLWLRCCGWYGLNRRLRSPS